MTKLDALQKLLTKVKAGDLDWPYCAVQHVHGIGMNESMWKAYNGSLDAAKTLHEAVLPRRYWEIWYFDGAWGATIPTSEDGGFKGISEETAARAWLIAIIKALIAEEAHNQGRGGDLLPEVLRSRAPKNSKYDQIRAADEIDRLRAALLSVRGILKRVGYADDSIAVEGIDTALGASN